MAGFDDDRVMAEYDVALDSALMELLQRLPPDEFADFSNWLWEIVTHGPAAPLPSREAANPDWAQFGPPLWP